MAEDDLGPEVSEGIASIRRLQELARSLAHARPMKALRERVLSRAKALNSDKLDITARRGAAPVASCTDVAFEDNRCP
jgi:hypothetical protein